MNFGVIKKYPVFTLCLGVTGLLLIAAAVGLFLSVRMYSRQAKALDAVTTRLQTLYRRDPLPVAANVLKESENLKDVIDQYNELNELLRSGQANPQPMEAADFMQFLEKSLRKLRDRLQSARIKIPEKYAFGFDKYAGGQLPALGDIPRLVQQLKIIEALCDILQDAGIAELVAIERENFEQASRGADAAGGRRGAPPPETAGGAPEGDKLVYSQHVKLSFKARENAVIEMLNLLASRPMFMVVTRVEMNNPRQDYSTGGSISAPVAARAPGAPAAPESSVRERQIILGREELDVKLDLDVCQFAPSLSFKEGGKR